MKPDQDAILKTLYRAHFHELEIHAYCFLGSWDDAHVAAQEAFHIACEKIDVLMKSENRIGWMKNVVKNVCRHMMRDRQRQKVLFSSLEDLTEAEMPYVTDETESQAADLFAGLLSEKELELLQKIIVEEVPYAEVAKKMNCSIWACRKQVQRAIDKLHKIYRDKFGEDFYL